MEKREREEEPPTQEKRTRVVGPLPLRVPLNTGAGISWPPRQSLSQATSAQLRPPVPLAPLAPLSSQLDPIAEVKKALEVISQWMRPIEILDEKKVLPFTFYLLLLLLPFTLYFYLYLLPFTLYFYFYLLPFTYFFYFLMIFIFSMSLCMTVRFGPPCWVQKFSLTIFWHAVF